MSFTYEPSSQLLHIYVEYSLSLSQSIRALLRSFPLQSRRIRTEQQIHQVKLSKVLPPRRVRRILRAHDPPSRLHLSPHLAPLPLTLHAPPPLPRAHVLVGTLAQLLVCEVGAPDVRYERCVRGGVRPYPYPQTSIFLVKPRSSRKWLNGLAKLKTEN